MPYTRQARLKIPAEYDRRVKLTDDDRENIKRRHLEGKEFMRALAREYGVNRTLIKFICYPEYLAHSKSLYKERRKDQRYYDKKLHTKQMKEHRRYKQKLLLENKLTTK